MAAISDSALATFSEEKKKGSARGIRIRLVTSAGVAAIDLINSNSAGSTSSRPRVVLIITGK
jgi:hypothetical protein